jgi:hypothetical protein
VKDTPSGRLWWVLGRSGLRTGESASGSWPTARAEDKEACGAHVSRGTAETLTAAARMWPTVTQPYGNNRGGGAGRVGPIRPSLAGSVREWPTSTAADGVGSGAAGYSTESGRHPGTTLTDAANGLWASPASRDWRGDSHAPAAQNRHSPCLPAHVGLVDQESPSTSGKSRDWPTSQARDWKGPQGRAYKGESMDLPATDGRGTLNSRWVVQLMGYPSDWLDVGTESLSRLWGTRSSRKSSP